MSAAGLRHGSPLELRDAMTDIRFEKGDEWRFDDRELVYRQSDYSFDVEARPEADGRTILVNELNLELDPENEVGAVWGLCAHTTWTPTTRFPPEAAQRRLRVAAGAPETPGVSRRLTTEDRWPVQVTQDGRWVVLGHGIEGDAGAAVEFAPGMIAVLGDEGDLQELWLRVEPR